MPCSNDTATFPAKPATPLEPARGRVAEDRLISILGVKITDVTRARAVQLLEQVIRRRDGRTRCAFFVNAHTLNLAAADPEYHRLLNSADYVFGDGTGVRWASRIQGRRVRDNLLGTDLTPELLSATAGRGYRYFLLGAREDSIYRAAQYATARFTGWTQAGYHHGYFTTPEQEADAVRQINQARPDLLLVGMGNPLQERWIHRHRHRLRVPLCMGVGGLFSYWAGDLNRSPRWLRRCGYEWLGILLQQPHKARRYLLGNPLFLYRVQISNAAFSRRRHPMRHLGCRGRREMLLLGLASEQLDDFSVIVGGDSSRRSSANSGTIGEFRHHRRIPAPSATGVASYRGLN